MDSLLKASDTVFMVEIRSDDSCWAVTPKIFQREEEAQAEGEALKARYPFISEYRIVAKKMEGKPENP